MSAADSALPDGYEFDRASVSHCDDLDRIESADGTPFRVLVSARDGERVVVHEDVVAYQGDYDHPMVTGLIGFLLVGGSLAALLGLTYELTALVSGPLVTAGVAAGGVVASWYASNILLYRTIAGGWLFRFLEWNEHKSLIVARRERGDLA